MTRALNAAPNGIDRVDFALARHFLARNAPASGALICTAIGPRLADPDSALETIEGVEIFWREDGDAEEDGVYRSRSSRRFDRRIAPSLRRRGSRKVA